MPDYVKLEEDLKSHPNLRAYGHLSVEKLEKMLVKQHLFLMSPESMSSGYLYQRQTELILKLKQEIKDGRE